MCKYTSDWLLFRAYKINSGQSEKANVSLKKLMFHSVDPIHSYLRIDTF